MIKRALLAVIMTNKNTNLVDKIIKACKNSTLKSKTSLPAYNILLLPRRPIIWETALGHLSQIAYNINTLTSFPNLKACAAQHRTAQSLRLVLSATARK
jgi:hypothetical protein